MAPRRRLLALVTVVLSVSCTDNLQPVFPAPITTTDLGTLGGTHSRAVAVNRLGQVAGGSDMAGDSLYHGVLWETQPR